MNKKQYEQFMADIDLLEKAKQISPEQATEQRQKVQEKYDNAQNKGGKKDNEKPPINENASAPKGKEKPLETSYINPKSYEECMERVKELGNVRRANKVAELKERALKNAKTPQERKEIMARNSVQDFTGGETKKTRVVKAFKSMLDYAEKQRIITLQNNPNDTEKVIKFKNNKAILEQAQEKVSIEVERALERFIVELHKRFEAGEDISKANFVVSINF
jgi:hypothetical protein